MTHNSLLLKYTPKAYDLHKILYNCLIRWNRFDIFVAMTELVVHLKRPTIDTTHLETNLTSTSLLKMWPFPAISVRQKVT